MNTVVFSAVILLILSAKTTEIIKVIKLHFHGASLITVAYGQNGAKRCVGHETDTWYEYFRG